MTGGPVAGAAEHTSPIEVLTFWRAAGPEKWFEKDAGLDAEIAARFLGLWRAAADGRLASWEETPDGALAATILLDQFRKLFRSALERQAMI